MNSNITKRNNRFNFKQKKDCCMQSLKEVNCFLYKFTKTKKIYDLLKFFK